MEKPVKKNRFERLITAINQLRKSIVDLTKTNNKTRKIYLYLFLIGLVLPTIPYIKKGIEFSIDLVSNNTHTKFTDSNKLNILIVQFHDSNDTKSKFKIEDVIENGLLAEKEYNDLPIEIKVDKKSLPPKDFEEAEKMRDKVNADIVIFGFIDSESKEYKINCAITNDYKRYEILPIKKRFTSEFKKNLELSKIFSLESLENEKFIIYTILGCSALKNHQTEKGISLLNKLFKEYPLTKKNVSYYYSLIAESYCENMEFEKALPYIETALEYDEDNNELRLYKAIILFIQQDREKAKVELETLISKKYEEYIVLMVRGFFNLFDGYYETAIADFECSKLKTPKDIDSFSAEFILCFIKGDFEKIINLSDKQRKDAKELFDILELWCYILDGNLKESINTLTKIEKNLTKINDNDFKKHTILVTKQIQKNIGLSEQEIDSTYNSISRNISQDANQNIKDALILTSLIRNKDDVKIIKKHLKHAIAINPDFRYNYNLNNLSKENVQEIKQRIKKNKAIIQIKPNDYMAFCHIANDYDTLGLAFIAKYYQIKAISINDLSAFHLNNQRYDSIKLKEFEIQFQNLNNLHKTSSDYKRAHYIKGYIFKKLGYFNLSEKEYKIYLVINPKDYDCITELSCVTYYRNKFEESLDYCNQMIRLNPRNFLGYNNRASAFVKLNQIEKAKKDIDKALILYVKIGDDNYHPNYKDLLSFKSSIESKIKNKVPE